MTKAERAVKAQKAAVQRRVALALAKYLKQQNPGQKLAGAKVQKLKGGVLKITPIQANAAKHILNRYFVFRGVQFQAAFSTIKSARNWISGMARQTGSKRSEFRIEKQPGILRRRIRW